MKKFLALLILAIILVNNSCIYKEIDKNLANAELLRVGMTKKQVLNVMGEPLQDQIDADENNWFYASEIRSLDGQYTRDECLVLVFENNKLLGFGKEFNAKRAFKEPVPQTE